MLSVSQAADILGVSCARVRALISTGSIPACKIGKSWVLAEEDVLDRVQSKPKAGRPASVMPEAEKSFVQVESLEEFASFYKLAKEKYSRYPSIEQLPQFATQEERNFAIAVADFFLQQKQRELIEQGVF